MCACEPPFVCSRCRADDDRAFLIANHVLDSHELDEAARLEARLSPSEGSGRDAWVRDDL